MELQKLKALAEEVKQWSNCNQAWLDQSEDDPAAVFGHIDEDGNTYPVATVDCDQYYEGQDSIKLARFYAAANPETVLRLVAMIESPNAGGNATERSEGRVDQRAPGYASAPNTEE